MYWLELPVQQSSSPRHTIPLPPHVIDIPAAHRPLRQLRPAQQSEFVWHALAVGRQHTPLVQGMTPQHSAAPVQAPPVGRHVPVMHRPPAQTSPEQQSLTLLHIALAWPQVGGVAQRPA